MTTTKTEDIEKENEAFIDKKIRPYQLNGWQVTLNMTDTELEIHKQFLKKKRKDN
tara:strand:- start:44 stop:208 length:165 start_codon:yes stop_codon:yes gene_type:complete